VEFVTGLFVGLVWWETAMVCLLIGVTIISAFAESGFGFLTAVILIGALYGMDKIDLSNIDYMKTLSISGLYLVVGLLWSGYKWFLYIKDAKQSYNKDLLASYNRLTNYEKISLEEYAASKYGNFKLPTSSSKAEEISVWIVFWVFSVISYIFSDMVKDIVKRLGGVYDAIARYAIK
jgi:hypothetical protein